MAELVTTGTWIVAPPRQAAFVEAWASFAEWASSQPGAGTLRLGVDGGDPTRYVSFGVWEDTASVRAWKSAPVFRERIARVLQHVGEFRPAELEVVAMATNGSSAVSAPTSSSVG
jgi:heme-degrading monooxygenase HmoA